MQVLFEVNLQVDKCFVQLVASMLVIYAHFLNVQLAPLSHQQDSFCEVF